MKISAVIISFNEERNIADAVNSVIWADEVVVVDSESADRTREIAAGLGARVITRKWPGFAEQKQFAADSAAHDRILSLDADERVTPELKDEILRIASSGGAADGYTIPRLSIYMGRAVRHGGWYPDRQMRFFDRRKGRWNERRVHESFVLNEGASSGTLKGDLLHYSVTSARDHHRMIGERYAPLAAEQAFAEGKRTNVLRLATAGPAAFTRSYFLKAGALDGVPGFAIASFAAHHAFLKHLLLWEKQNGERG